MLENLKLRGSIYSDVDQWINDKHLNLKSEYKNIFKNKNSNYWQNEKQKIEKYLKQQGIEGKIYFEY
jgi:inhibitor of KinA sporulation pathway (predicted exonuclease)